MRQDKWQESRVSADIRCGVVDSSDILEHELQMQWLQYLDGLFRLMNLKLAQRQPAMSRLFFALWPCEAVSAGLIEAGEYLHGICGGRLTRVETIHLTLVFLGDVEPERIGNLLELAGDIRVSSFCIGLTRLGWWPNNRIVWAAPEAMPPELTRLVDWLRESLNNAGFHFDTKPFVPHITLLRKGNCKDNPLPALDVKWRAENFVLVRSVSGDGGSAYEVLGSWPLLPTD